MSLEPRSFEPNDRNEQPRPGIAVRASHFAGALEVCRDALIAAPFNPVYAAMREPVAALAATASRDGVPPEHLLHAFKEVLSRLPRFEESDPLTREEVVGELVSLAITSYYARQADGPAPPSDD